MPTLRSTTSPEGRAQKARRVDMPPKISLTRAYVAATAAPPMTYADAAALLGADQRVKSASKTISEWQKQGPSEVLVCRGGEVASLEDLVAFFFHHPDRLKKVGSFFLPPLWGQALFDAVGHTGPDPLSDKQRDQAESVGGALVALPVSWQERLDEVLAVVRFGDADRQTIRELWEELAGVGPHQELDSHTRLGLPAVLVREAVRRRCSGSAPHPPPLQPQPRSLP